MNATNNLKHENIAFDNIKENKNHFSFNSTGKEESIKIDKIIDNETEIFEISKYRNDKYNSHTEDIKNDNDESCTKKLYNENDKCSSVMSNDQKSKICLNIVKCTFSEDTTKMNAYCEIYADHEFIDKSNIASGTIPTWD